MTLWHVLRWVSSPVSGMPRFINYLPRMFYAFPNEMKAREGDYPLMFTKLYPGIKQERGIKEYLRGGRRLKFNPSTECSVITQNLTDS